VQEIFGVHEHIKDVCRRFAKLGYYAVAPELFARAADVSKLSTIEEGRAAAAKVSDRQVMADLDSAATFAKLERGDTTRLGITGFCWGGRIVWLYSAHSPQLRAGVAWYGRLTGPTNEMQPKHPLDLVDSLKAPVLGLYGGADQGIPNADVEKMRAALKNAAKPSEIVLYDGAPHGFHADYRPSYREASAKDGWQRLQNWFQKHGAA
jgi:carboxymethylenebutenolidase